MWEFLWMGNGNIASFYMELGFLMTNNFPMKPYSYET